MTWFILQFGVISTCKFFKEYKLHPSYGLVQFCCFWKIYSCLWTPNYTRNQVIPYTDNAFNTITQKKFENLGLTMSICFLSSTTWADIAAFSLINAVQSSWIWKKKTVLSKKYSIAIQLWINKITIIMVWKLGNNE